MRQLSRELQKSHCIRNWVFSCIWFPSVLAADSEPEPHPAIIVFNTETVPNNIITFFGFIYGLLILIETTAIIVCLIHLDNLFVVKCFLDAVNVMKHFSGKEVPAIVLAVDREMEIEYNSPKIHLDSERGEQSELRCFRFGVESGCRSADKNGEQPVV